MAKNPWKKMMHNVKTAANNSAGMRMNTYPAIKELRDKGSGGLVSGAGRLIEITASDIKTQFYKQEGLCYWSGIELDPMLVFRTGDPLTPSVDRLDNNKGYEVSNIVICCRLMNLGRGNCSPEKFRDAVARLKLPNSELVYIQFCK